MSFLIPRGRPGGAVAAPGLAPEPPPRVRLSTPLTAIGIVLFVAIGAAAWLGGYQYALLRSEQSVAELTDAQSRLTSLAVQLERFKAERAALEKTLAASGTAQSAEQMEAMRRQVLALQAQNNALTAIAQRDQRSRANDDTLAVLLSSTGVQLIAMHAAPAAADTVAYVLLVPDSKMLLVASHLPQPAYRQSYYVWAYRKGDPRAVSCGELVTDASGRATLQFSLGDTLSDIESVTVTEQNSSEADTAVGTPILSGSPGS